MRALVRLPEPEILIDKSTSWLTDFLKSGKKRPDSSKYAHASIRTQLNSISFNKCFYCEIKLKGKSREVDHHIEVSVDTTLAFQWDNLYLSCDTCNNKIPHSSISIKDALDPCKNTDTEIIENLTFVDEFIEAKNNSELGLRTIQKYRLDSDILETRRLQSLKIFLKLICEIKDNQIKDSRDYLTSDETNAIYRFKMLDNSFSLMYLIIIDKFGF